MRWIRLVCLPGLLFSASWIVAAQAVLQYPVCQMPLAIGEVPNEPFTAQFVEDAWKIAPDGSKQAIDLSDAKVGFVARDSKGRVMVRSQVKLIQSSGAKKAEVPGYSVTICDPADGTVTRISYADAFHLGIDSATGEAVYLPAGISGTATVMPQGKVHTTVLFQDWQREIKGRTNLGPESFEGFPAYRFRLGPHENDFVDADELSLQLAQTRWQEDSSSIREQKLTHIHLGEPSPQTFDIPNGVAIYDPRKQAAARALNPPPPPHTPPATFTCSAGWRAVAVVKHKPFTADIVHTEWQIAPDGSKKNKLVFEGYIARDSEGRVAERTPTRSHRTPALAENEPNINDQLETFLCDPVSQTQAKITSTYAQVKPQRYAEAPADLFQNLLHPAKETIVNDLGLKDVVGVPTHGYRSELTMGGSTAKAVAEEWVSEDLSLEVFYLETQPTFVTKSAITHLRREEPDAALFKVPPGLPDSLPRPARAPLAPTPLADIMQTIRQMSDSQGASLLKPPVK